MNTKKIILLTSIATACLGLTSCVVAPGPYYGRPVVRPGVVVYGPDVYAAVPVGYVGSYYYYGGRYYTGGRYEVGRYYWNGQYYPHRYWHRGRYLYGGRHYVR